MLVHGREAVADGGVYPSASVLDELIIEPRDKYATDLGHLKDIFIKVSGLLQKAHDRNVKYYNRKRRDVVFKVGDFVWKRTYVQSAGSKYFSAKLAPKYERCRIVKKLSPLVYELESEQGRPLGRWHIKDFK